MMRVRMFFWIANILVIHTRRHHHPAPQLSDLSEEDSIQTILNTIGVKYSHLNDEILMPSRIEEERTKKSVMACVHCYL